jgi:enamine deaminase RidA (YjgF/YER057c/UK114 family)
MTQIERQHSTTRMSKIVKYGGLVFLCGQTAKGSASASADVSAQTEEVLSRIDALLAEAGSDRAKVLSVTIHLRDIGDFAAMNTVWESWITAETAPARTTVEAKLATPGVLVEMTVIAATVDVHP